MMLNLKFAVAVVGATATTFVVTTAPVRAQAEPPADTSATAPAGNLRTVDQVVSGIARSTALVVLADSTVGKTMVAPLSEEVTADNLETQLTALVKKLPRGTAWAKLYLPASTRPYKGDDVADYALAQARLFGPVGAAATGTVEILGQKVPSEKAAPVVSTLALKPVYLITNPYTRTAGGKSGAADWSQMTPEQKQAYAQQQAQNLLNMDPTARNQAMGQMMEQQMSIFRSLMGSMNNEQRQQFFQSMRDQGGFGGAGGGGFPRPRGGRGGAGNYNPPGPGGN